MWKIKGSAEQQKIVVAAISKIKFPFERLSLPEGAELGWQDLNSKAAIESRIGSEADTHEGLFEGRQYILGVFYPSTASIYLDEKLINHPEMAEATVSAEIAHAVDYYLPLTDLMRDTFVRLLNDGKPNSETWWEKSNYSTEYFTLAGEIFMLLFTKGYSDIPFGNASDFSHDGSNISPAQIRAVIGIERTDAAPLHPAGSGFVSYGKSKIYHLPTHYRKPGKPVAALEDFRFCGVCRKTQAVITS